MLPLQAHVTTGSLGPESVTGWNVCHLRVLDLWVLEIARPSTPSATCARTGPLWHTKTINAALARRFYFMLHADWQPLHRFLSPAVVGGPSQAAAQQHVAHRDARSNRARDVDRTLTAALCQRGALALAPHTTRSSNGSDRGAGAHVRQAGHRVSAAFQPAFGVSA